jgi:hypothetical protein
MSKKTESEPKVRPTYWELDEEHNALDYLEMSVRSLMEVERTPLAWKWVCIALHGALYGFAVCAVKGTTYTRVAYPTKGGRYKLKRFDDILKMCQDDVWMKQYVDSKTLVLSNDQKETIDFLKNEVRNCVEHFVPLSWLIEIHGLPKMIATYFDIIKFLALESGNVHFRLKDYEISRVKTLCDSGKELALSTKIHQEISEKN